MTLALSLASLWCLVGCVAPGSARHAQFNEPSPTPGFAIHGTANVFPDVAFQDVIGTLRANQIPIDGTSSDRSVSSGYVILMPTGDTTSPDMRLRYKFDISVSPTIHRGASKIDVRPTMEAYHSDGSGLRDVSSSSPEGIEHLHDWFLERLETFIADNQVNGRVQVAESAPIERSTRTTHLPVSGTFARDGLECNMLLASNITAVTDTSITLDGHTGTIFNLRQNRGSYEFDLTGSETVHEALIPTSRGFTLRNQFGIFNYTICITVMTTQTANQSATQNPPARTSPLSTAGSFCPTLAAVVNATYQHSAASTAPALPGSIEARAYSPSGYHAIFLVDPSHTGANQLALVGRLDSLIKTVHSCYPNVAGKPYAELRASGTEFAVPGMANIQVGIGPHFGTQGREGNETYTDITSR